MRDHSPSGLGQASPQAALLTAPVDLPPQPATRAASASAAVGVEERKARFMAARVEPSSDPEEIRPGGTTSARRAPTRRGARAYARAVTDRALILVDLQYDFCPGGALAVARGDETIAVANRVARRFETVVATQDWHPRDHGSFAANHDRAAPYQAIDLNGLAQVLWPVHCVQGSRGAELRDDLDRARIAAVFPKGTDPAVDSYSGFWDNGQRHATGLGDCLRARGVTTVYVLGLATDYCVKFTALDACREGFATYLVEDGCRAVDLAPGDGERAIDAMRAAGVIVVDSGQIGT